MLTFKHTIKLDRANFSLSDTEDFRKGDVRTVGETGKPEKGVYYRATRQKECILENEFSCCKEIYCQVSKVDSSIGIATVYRMVNTLEEIGAINRKSMYHVCFEEEPAAVHSCMVKFDDRTQLNLNAEEWNRIVKAGLETCGYLDNRNVELIELRECNDNIAAAM